MQAAYWSVPWREIPEDPNELSAWLLGQWEEVDRWITEHEAAAFDRHDPA